MKLNIPTGKQECDGKDCTNEVNEDHPAKLNLCHKCRAKAGF